MCAAVTKGPCPPLGALKKSNDPADILLPLIVYCSESPFVNVLLVL
jgi:hypothetical protein